MPASVGPLALRICSWLVVGAIAAVPVASLVIGSTLAWRSVGLMLSGARMDAIVVDVEISSSNQGKALYSPIVRYSCGEVDTVGQSGISSNERYEPGQHVYVYCDPAAPERFIMDTFGEKYLGMIFMVPGLLLLAVVGGTALRRSRRKKLRHAWIPVEGMIVAMPAQDEEDIDDPALAVRFTHPASGTTMEVATEDIPGEYAARLRVGEKLTVYADPRDTKRYWIDIKPSK